jgi:membrane-associated protein
MFDAIIARLTGFSSLEELIAWGGIALLALIVFAETGLLVGFFLPGDSLLFTAGLIAGTGLFDIRALILALIAAAISGDQVGYSTGRFVGKKLLDRPDGRFFRRSYVKRTHAFYEKYGAKTIVLARFVPIVRTFAPIVAGVGEMRYRTFLTYNVVGGAGWVLLMCGAGYWLGQFAWVNTYLHLVILFIILTSLVPVGWELWKARKGVKR